MAVMIGVDPHKRSHMAVAVDGDEVELGRLEVRASRGQVDELRAWAARFGEHGQRLLAKRNKQLASVRTAAACRLHALLAELVPGGIPKEITPNRAERLLETVTPTDPVSATRHMLRSSISRICAAPTRSFEHCTAR